MPHKFVNSRQCAAPDRKKGGRCGGYACKDSIYCRRCGGSQVGHVMPPQTKAGLTEGTQNYWARMRQALADGLITHYPNASPEALEAKSTKMKLLIADRRAQGLPVGRQPKGTRKKKQPADMPPPDKTILQAEKALIYEKAALPAPIDKPFEEQEDHEKLQTLTGMSLDTVQEVLRLPIYEKGPDGKTMVLNLKLLAIKKDTALRTLAVRVKVDRNSLAARRTDGTFNLMKRLLEEKKPGDRQPGDDAKVIEQEPERKKA